LASTIRTSSREFSIAMPASSQGRLAAAHALVTPAR
jgi:hypothetical protein